MKALALLLQIHNIQPLPLTTIRVKLVYVNKQEADLAVKGKCRDDSARGDVEDARQAAAGDGHQLLLGVHAPAACRALQCLAPV